MSRREDRTSDAKRHRSRFDREPSPKRSRRDGKPETETPLTNSNDRNRDQKSRRRLQDALPLDDPLVHDMKNETKTMRKESEDKNNEIQHDDRGSAGKNGRSSARRSDKERGYRKEQPHDQTDDTAVASDAQRKDERPKNIRASDTQRKDDKPKDSRDVWRHDGYFEMEANRKPSERKRPAFREQKISSDPEKNNKAADLVMPNPQDHAVESGKRRERPSYGVRELTRVMDEGVNFHHWIGMVQDIETVEEMGLVVGGTLVQVEVGLRNGNMTYIMRRIEVQPQRMKKTRFQRLKLFWQNNVQIHYLGMGLKSELVNCCFPCPTTNPVQNPFDPIQWRINQYSICSLLYG